MKARNPDGVFFRLATGIPLVLAGLLLLGWIAATRIIGFDQVVNAAVPYLGIEQYVLYRFASGFENLIFCAGVAALFIGGFMLMAAQRASLGADTGSDGKSRFELSTPARIGGTLAGQVFLGPKAVVGNRYRLLLTCENTAASRAGSTVAKYAHGQEIEVAAVPGVDGARLPFRFEIPPSAPPTSRDHSWSLTALAPKKWFGSTFDLEVTA